MCKQTIFDALFTNSVSHSLVQGWHVCARVAEEKSPKKQHPCLRACEANYEKKWREKENRLKNCICNLVHAIIIITYIRRYYSGIIAIIGISVCHHTATRPTWHGHQSINMPNSNTVIIIIIIIINTNHIQYCCRLQSPEKWYHTCVTLATKQRL